MWTWLTLSLLLVIACIIFGIQYFRSNRALQKTISRENPYQKYKAQLPPNENEFPVIQEQNFSNFKQKFKSIEEDSAMHVQQLNTLQKRIEALEKGNSFKDEDQNWDDNGEGEDWEKMYYESKREKESLESELEITRQDLEEAQMRFNETGKQQTGLSEIKSELETKMNEIYSLQNTIEDLQRKLEGASNREQELQDQLESVKDLVMENELLKKQNNRLLFETDDLSGRLMEINARNAAMEQKIKRLTELESSLEISEFEKQEIKNSVEQIYTENAALSKKLQQQYRSMEERNLGRSG